MPSRGGGSRSQTHYETIPLVRGAHSSGMPVRGVMVDPDQRNIYAVVGGPTESSKPADFFILWKGKNGETFSATFPKGEARRGSAVAGDVGWQIAPACRSRCRRNRMTEQVSDNTVRANTEATLQTIVTSLSSQTDGVARR